MYQFIINIDIAVSNFFISHASPIIGDIAKQITFLADTNTLIVVLAVVGIISFFRRDSNFVNIVAATAVSSVFINLSKKYFDRLRPHQILYDVRHYGYAFPSGHSMFAAVVYGLIGYWCVCACPKKWQKIAVSILTFLLIVAIGLSRLALNVHWLSDVVAGWFFGGLILFAAIKFHKRAKM